MLLFHNGTIHTIDSLNPQAEAVLVGDDGRILIVGKLADAEAAAKAGTQRVDLAGRTLIPGFNDAHVHIWKMGLLLTRQVVANKTTAPDIENIIERFRDKAEVWPTGTWITGRGYNESDLPERRHPTDGHWRKDLPVSPSCRHAVCAAGLW